jgi:hypothetical protein
MFHHPRLAPTQKLRGTEVQPSSPGRPQRSGERSSCRAMFFRVSAGLKFA